MHNFGGETCQLGSPRKRWKDNIKTDLSVTGWLGIVAPRCSILVFPSALPLVWFVGHGHDICKACR
jgi:hypothetical protein